MIIENLTKLKLSILFLIFFFTLQFLLFLAPVYAASSATFSLSPASGSFSQSASFDVSILLNSNGAKIDGIDAQLTFDPAALEILSINQTTLFPTYPVKTSDNSAGTITVSAVANPGEPIATSTPTALASIRVKPRKAGSASVNYVFVKGSTTDSNVVENATNLDILTSVNNANFSIVASGPGAPPGSGQLPSAGVIENTLLLLGGGLSLIFFGSWSLRKKLSL